MLASNCKAILSHPDYRKTKEVFIPLSGGFDSRTMAGIAASEGLETFTCTLGLKTSRDYRYGTKIGKQLRTHRNYVQLPHL